MSFHTASAESRLTALTPKGPVKIFLIVQHYFLNCNAMRTFITYINNMQALKRIYDMFNKILKQ